MVLNFSEGSQFAIKFALPVDTKGQQKVPDSPELNMFFTVGDDVTVLSSFDHEFKNICPEPKATTI